MRNKSKNLKIPVLKTTEYMTIITLMFLYSENQNLVGNLLPKTMKVKTPQ